MSNIDIDGFPALELDNLIKLKKIKKINDFQMINYQKKYMIDTTFPNASVETLLHSFLPHKYVDHTHSNAILSIINQPNDKNICKKIFGEDLGLVPYIMPGFKLSKKAFEVFEKNPKVKGLLLLNHGIFTFGNTAKQSYERMIKYVSLAERELRKRSSYIKRNQYKENKVTPSYLANIFRKYISIPFGDDYQRKIICYSNTLFLNQFFDKNFFTKIKGPITPDHVIRIKHKPLFLDFKKVKNNEIEKVIKKNIINYQKKYINYFNRNKHLNKNAQMHDPNPRLIVVKGLGLFATGKNFNEAKIAMDVGTNSLSVMIDAFNYNKFKSISEKEIFCMEYWPLELAKLKNTNLSLQGNVTVITGGLGTIGYKTALKFLNEGSEVILLDNIKNNKNIKGMSYFECDVTIESEINKVLNKISE